MPIQFIHDYCSLIHLGIHRLSSVNTALLIIGLFLLLISIIIGVVIAIVVWKFKDQVENHEGIFYG